MATRERTRREFLLEGGALIVGFSLGAPVADGPGLLAQTPLPKTPPAPAPAAGVPPAPAKPVAPDDVDAFLAIAADGSVTLYTGKVDLGTGIRTALPQMAAEELDVPYERVRLVEGDTALTPDQGPTWGSLSIQAGGVQIRQAAATARRALLDLAGAQLAVPPAGLDVRDGVVFVREEPSRRVAYADLLGDRPFQLKLDRDAPLKDPARYTIVGQSIPRVDIQAKVTGQFTYMQDVRVPGMLHARVVRPPALGAALVSVDESSVGGIRGFKRLVRAGSFLAVVAETEWGAIKAASRLKATWSKWEGLPEMAQLYEHVRRTPSAKDEVTATVGDPAAALARAVRAHKATYEFAVHTHGSIGPSCAVADWRKGSLTVWSASQAPHWLRRELAGVLEMDPAEIRVIYVDGAGCYGRNGHEDAALDAVLGSRADEHGWDPKGPPTLVDVEGGLDAAGQVVAWRSEFWIPRLSAITDGVPFVAATLAGLPHKDAINPGNIFQNSAPSYVLPNVHAVCHRLESTPFRPSWIRTPGRMQNTFANETFMDELAALAGADPVEFRLRHLADPRGIAVLRAAALRGGWRPRRRPRKRPPLATTLVGQGVSYVKYENVRTYVAAVAEVEVDRPSGALRVTRVAIAHDCGLVVNPDGVRAQIEGGVIQTVSRTLKEELRWDRARVTSLDWVTYPILRFPEVPEVEIELLSRPTEPPWGAGEPTAAVIPSAISNAIFDATGARLRTVPFTTERVKAALRALA
ncbi:MAG: xanthine dehydrogenase family protein molybdopterin-binding subunit [Candidatus Rokuibacteriota bacterium]|nr:MAG: xanthine dehydrogenase family protein molybdopterin-binding subunit [Candidatus Rokubacteria bacterium]